MFLPSQLPTETDVIDWNKLELKHEMASHPEPAGTSGNRVLPDMPSSSQGAGLNNNHRNHSIDL